MKPKRKRSRAPGEEREGETLADDLIADDPIPPDARRFDSDGKRLPTKKQ